MTQKLSYIYKACTLALMMLICSAAWGAPGERVIGGIVVDTNGEPMPGAQVKEVPLDPANSAHAVIVDHQGHFSLKLTPGIKEIEVSYVGFKTKRVALSTSDSYRIVLEENKSLLDDVVVTGYQTISKERATGSFVKVNTEDLAGQRLSDVTTFLEGHVAGYSDGRIRGVTSMNGVTSPLYVIDGFPVENTSYDGYSYNEGLLGVNVEDIESITVLKDAAATSIYGARAANGVIVITTKRASKSTTNVSFSASLTMQPYRTYTGIYADAATIIDIEKEWAAVNPYLTGESAASYAQNLLTNRTYTSQGIMSILNYYAGNITEAQMNSTLNALAQKGNSYYADIDKYGKSNPFYQQYNMSISNGNDKNNFYASVTYRHNQASDKYTNDESIGINLRNTTKLTNWVTLELGAYVNYADSQTQGFSLFSPGYTVMPYDNLVNSDGSFITNTQEERYSQSNLNTLNNYGLYNLDITALDEIGMNLTKQKNLSTRVTARLVFDITDWLRFTPQFQYEANEYRTENLQEKETYYVRNYVNTFATVGSDGSTTFNLPYGNIMTRSNNSVRNYNLRMQLDFNKTFNGVHDVTALAGMEMKENKIEYANYSLYNYDPDLLTFGLINQQVLNSTYGVWGWASFYSQNAAAQTELINRYISFYGNGAYTYDGKYTVNGSIRWDRTNLFGTSSTYQNKPIWSAGAGWNISKEAFFNVDQVNMLKLRASYGIGGNIAKNNWPYMTAYYSTNTKIDRTYGYISSRPNPNLRWEKTTTFNVGFDFAAFNNRVTGSIEYYNKSGSDLLANTNGVPTEGWGYSTYTINNGKMRNRGYEINLNTVPYQSRDWTWTLGGTFGHNQNKVTYVNVECPVLYLVFDYASAYPRVGNPYNALYAYDFVGLNEDGLPMIQDQNGNIYTNSQPSSVYDAIYAGTTVPIWNGSINTSIRWRQFTLSAMGLFEGGHKMRNTLTTYPGIGFVSYEVANRWKEAGDENTTTIPRYVPGVSSLYNYYSSDLYNNSTARILDASNFQLRNVSLRYELPGVWAQKCYMKGASLMVGMENVCTLAKSKTAKYLLGGYNRPNYTMTLNVNF